MAQIDYSNYTVEQLIDVQQNIAETTTGVAPGRFLFRRDVCPFQVRLRLAVVFRSVSNLCFRTFSLVPRRRARSGFEPNCLFLESVELIFHRKHSSRATVRIVNRLCIGCALGEERGQM